MARFLNYFELKQRMLEERDKIPTAPNTHNNAMRGGIRKALRCLERCQSVTDMVEVVRCKDCKWRQQDDVNRNFCGLGDFYCGDTDFCSRGEREDNENTK